MTITDPTDLERDYRTAIADAEALQRRLSAMTKDDPRREQLKADLAAAVDRGRNAKEAMKQATARRNFAGIGSPLHMACAARLAPGLLLELEEAAMALLDERGRVAAERRRKAAAAPPAVPATPAVETTAPALRTMAAHREPEVFHALPRSPVSLPAAATPSPRSPPPPRPQSRGREVADAFREAGRR